MYKEIRMWKRWENKNTPLKTVVKIISRFFEERNFRVGVIKAKNGYEVTAFPRIGCGVTEKIKIRVLGHPNEFKVEFDAGSNSRALVLLGNILSLLGGGIFAKRGLENLEGLEKLEREFWIYIEEILNNISSQAKH
ncbi:MAG: hypothetical protein ACTSV7_00315 [Candidatus Baldrarchaeia archaeon]